MKRYIYIIVTMLWVAFAIKGQDAGKFRGDRARRSDLMGMDNFQEGCLTKSLELRKDSFFYNYRYRRVDIHVHFTERIMPNIKFSQPLITHICGTVSAGNSDELLVAYIRLMFEIDGILYTSNIETISDLDNVFHISYPDYLSQSPNVKKLLLIERVGFMRQLINIDSLAHGGVLNITLQPQAAFPTVHIRKGEYYIDLSPLESEGWKLPAPSVGFHDFYKSICAILHESSNKDMTLHLKFSKDGMLEEVNGENTYGGITCYLKELKWRPARLYNGKVIPLDISLNVVLDVAK